MSDLIDRQVALDALAEHEKSKNHNYYLFRTVVSECAEIIRDVPTIEERKGKWIIKPHKMMGEAPCCSECGMFEPMERNFCPNCGARMEVESDGGNS